MLEYSHAHAGDHESAEASGTVKGPAKSSFREAFANRHVILPVIHVDSAAQALRNANIASEAGCDGVFLINHGMSHEQLLEIHGLVSGELPGWWIGVNCLDLAPEEVFGKIGRSVAGVWVDNAKIDERVEQQPDAENILRARTEAGWHGLYFGGVAFKYQREVGDLKQAARVAARHMDVVTTSGPGTGQAAFREKISTMKQAIADSPLAIPSGITPENVHDYLDVADCFLVATGISTEFTELDPARVGALVRAVRSF